jgi:hypothetical protein
MRRASAAAAKRKSSVPANPETAVPAHDSAGHWTQRIEPKGAALLAETLGRVYFVIKNHGPNGVFLVAAHGDAMDLPSGAVRATYAHGIIQVVNKSEDPVLVEFEFLPIFLKPY